MGRVAIESLSLQYVMSIHLSLRSTGDFLEQAMLGRVPSRLGGLYELASSGDALRELSAHGAKRHH